MSTPPPIPRPGIRTISDAQALAAMANPQRVRLLDVLHLDGPATASALARRTDLAVGSVSHHLKVLDRAGLVEEAAELARDRRERWWRLASAGFRWSRSEFADQPATVAAARSAESIALRRQFERARDWLDEAPIDGEWDDAAFATQNWLRLTPAELRAVNEEILDVLHRWRTREIPDDGQTRESVLVFSRGFPAQP